MKDDDMEVYDGQNSLEDWHTSSDLSMISPEKEVKNRNQDGSDMLTELDDFTYAWDDPPGSIPIWDELSTCLLKPADGKRNSTLCLGKRLV